jgi:hypothetical protein
VDARASLLRQPRPSPQGSTDATDPFIPFLDYDLEIRRVICSTNAIESLNARYRRAIKARGHFPSEQAALKCLYRDHLRRPVPGRRDLLTEDAGNTASETDPNPINATPLLGR